MKNKAIIISSIILIGIIVLIVSVIIHNSQNNKTSKNNMNAETFELNGNIALKNTIQNEIQEEKNQTNIIENTKIETAITTAIEPTQNNIEEEKKIDMIKISVNNRVLNVKLENNSSADALVEKLKNGAITINAHEYGNFEKVGLLGFSLPRNDRNITTEPGDLILYQGNQLTLYYDTNTWSFTKLGKVQNVSKSELKNILGEGDVTLVLSIE